MSDQTQTTPIGHTTWNPDTVRRVAEAIAGVLFEENPGETVGRVILYGAAMALEVIGREIASGCRDGSTIELPHPRTVFGEDAANV